MNTKVMAIVVVAILACAGIGVAVYEVTKDNGNHGDRTVTDMRGREVSIPNEVNKVVCVSAGALRMVSYFDIDRVVGVDSMDKGTSGSADNYNLATYRVAYGDKIKEMTDVGGASNFKEMMDTGADVIFTTTEGVDVLDNIQEKTGIPVIGLRAEVYFDLDSMQTFAKQMKLIGEVLKMESRADELVDGIESLFAELETYKLSATESDFKKSYVCGLMTGMTGNFYKTTGHFLPFSTTVGLNIAPDVAQSPYLINEKDIIDQDPAYIFVDVSNYAEQSGDSEGEQRDPRYRLSGLQREGLLAPPVQVLQHQLRERAHQLFRRRKHSRSLGPQLRSDREGQLDIPAVLPRFVHHPGLVHNGNRPRHRTGLRDGIQVRIPPQTPSQTSSQTSFPKLDSDGQQGEVSEKLETPQSRDHHSGYNNGLGGLHHPCRREHQRGPFRDIQGIGDVRYLHKRGQVRLADRHAHDSHPH